jgi:hypothetical protein
MLSASIPDIDSISDLEYPNSVDWLPNYPGVQFESTDARFASLLGCENGYAQAYFLADHREVFGIRQIARIQAFTRNNEIYIIYYTNSP